MRPAPPRGRGSRHELGERAAQARTAGALARRARCEWRVATSLKCRCRKRRTAYVDESHDRSNPRPLDGFLIIMLAPWPRSWLPRASAEVDAAAVVLVGLTALRACPARHFCAQSAPLPVWLTLPGPIPRATEVGNHQASDGSHFVTMRARVAADRNTMSKNRTIGPIF